MDGQKKIKIYISYTFAALVLVLLLYSMNYIMDIRGNVDLRTDIANRTNAVLSLEDTFSSADALWWPGLIGVEPRYLDGSMKGLGVDEFPAYQVKKMLSQQLGVKLIDWMASPSRVEAEFKLNRRPVCIYPYAWSDPEKEFSQEPRWLYSLPLLLGGRQVFSILHRKEDTHKFKKYLNDIGNLDLLSLLSDSTLRTYIITGENYPSTIKQLLYQDKNGKWSVQKGFEKQITLLVASNNQQLLQMLKNQRIDYLLDSLVTDEHFLKMNIPLDYFNKIPYQRNEVKSGRDSNLIYYSVRCNKHPKSFEYMAHINNFIGGNNPVSNRLGSENHREKLVEGYRHKIPQWELLEQTLGSDRYWWIDKYINLIGMTSEQFSGANRTKKNEKNMSSVKIKLSSPASRKVELKLYLDGNQIYALNMGEREFALEFKGTDWRDNNSFYPLSKMAHLLEAIGPEGRKFLTQAPEIDWKSLDHTRVMKVRRLFLSASGLTAQQLKRWVDRFPRLEVLEIFYPDPSALELLQPNRIAKLKGLSIFEGKIKKNFLASMTRSNKLRFLRLAGSDVKEDEVLALIKKNALTLETLDLSDLPQLFTPRFVDALASLSWPMLRDFRIRKCNLSASQLQEIFAVLPKELNILTLEGNYLMPENFEYIFTHFKFLRKIKVFEHRFISKHQKDYYISDAMEEIMLNPMGITAELIKKVHLPKKLRMFEIGQNPIGDRGLVYLAEQFPETLETLNINSIESSAHGLREAFFPPNQPVRKWLHGLKSLSLTRMRVDDAFVEKLQQHAPNLEILEVGDNLISDRGIASIQTFPKLHTLGIGANFVTRKGLEQLYQSAIYSRFQSLGLFGMLDFRVKDFVQWIPQALHTLDLAGNNLQEADMSQIISVLPKTLLKFDIKGNSFSDQTAVIFDGNKLAKLKMFNADLYALKADSLRKLLERLPNNLYQLDLNTYPAVPDQSEKWSFPRVENLSMWFSTGKIGHLSKLFVDKLPHTIRRLQIPDIDEKGIRELNRSFSLTEGNFSGQITKKILRSRFYISGYSLSGKQLTELLRSGTSSIGLYPVAGALPENLSAYQMTKSRSENIHRLAIHGAKISDAFIMELVKHRLSGVNYLLAGSNPFTVKGLIALLKAISPEARDISIDSANLRYEDIDAVLAALPPHLVRLSVRGLKIGERGYQKIRDWIEEKERLAGYPIDLGE